MLTKKTGSATPVRRIDRKLRAVLTDGPCPLERTGLGSAKDGKGKQRDGLVEREKGKGKREQGKKRRTELLLLLSFSST